MLFRSAVGRVVALPMTLAFDHPNLDALIAFFERHSRSANETKTHTAAAAVVSAVSASVDEPIAIVGMGCRFPGGAHDPKTFWCNLSEGRDAIGEVPESRWKMSATTEVSG